MRNLELARVLEEIGDLLELAGDNPFKVRAYRRAAQAVELLPEDIEAVWQAGRLRELEGVGGAIAGKIGEYLADGKIAYHEELKGRVPPGLLQLLEIPGVGARLAQRLHGELGITSLAELEAACRAQKLRGVKGLGAKSEAKILRGIEQLRTRSGRIPAGIARPLAQALAGRLATLAPVARVEVAGSLRRRRETVGDIDLVCASDDAEPVMEAFCSFPEVREVSMRGTTRSSVVLAHGLRADLRAVAPEEFAAALLHFTGSKEHNVRLREMAHARGLKISEYGVFRSEDGARLPTEREEDLYALLGLAFIPPELREDAGEIEAARSGRLPRLVGERDLQGDLHVHSTWSDGTATIREMATAARARGHRYLAVCDHSRALGIAKGLDPERLARQGEEIARVNGELEGLRVLAGTEVDILADGRLAFPDEVLAALDVVVASVHSSFQQERDSMTRRVLAALHNEHVDILAHPTGRILGRRDPYALDLEEVLRAAAETGTALEINASPDRLDLGDGAARRAKELGVMLVINTDAHAPDQLAQLGLGVGVARRAWLEAGDILNTRSPAELEEWLRLPKAERARRRSR